MVLLLRNAFGSYIVVYTLLRQFSDDLSLHHQRAMVMGYLQSHNRTAEKEMIEFGSQGKPLAERQQFETFLRSLAPGDHVVIDEIQTLGGTTEEILTVINCMLSREVILELASVELVVGGQTPLSALLPLIMQVNAEREEESRRSQKGRPRGSKSASKFDTYLDRIIAQLKAGENVSAIARDLDVSRSSLKDYIESRQLKKILDESWMERLASRYHPNPKGAPELVCTLNP